MQVFFVCLGNIYRSPTAGGVLHHTLRQARLTGQIDVASTGTGDWNVGNLLDPHSRPAALVRVYDLSAQRAQKIFRAVTFEQGRAGFVHDLYHDGEQEFERIVGLIERAYDLLVIELKGWL